MLDFTQCDWIDLTKLTRYHQNLMSFLSENYLNKSGGTINGQINSCSILPKSPSSYNLGSSTNQWSNIYSNGFVLVDSTGQIRPNSTGTGNIGTSSYYWGNAYINNITSGNIVPKTDNTYDIGSSSYKFKDGYFNGWLYATHFISANGNVRPSVNGQGSIGTSSYYWSAGYINSLTTGSIISKTDNTYDLGSSSKRWKNIYVNSLNTNNITAQTDNTYDLGSTSYYWKDAYINNIYGIAIYQNGNQVWDKSNLQVGGRNLLLDSKRERMISTSSATYMLISLSDYAKTKLSEQKIFCVKFLAKFSNVQNLTSFTCYLRSSSSAIGNDGYFDYSSAVVDEYKEYSAIIDNSNKANITSAINLAIRFSHDAGSTVRLYVKEAKLEFGNIATDYSPAPEDTDALITTAQNKADSAYSNNQATQTQLDNLQVGGRNLARYTSKTITQDNYSNEKIYDFSNYAIKILKNLPITITISTHVKGTNLVLSGDAVIGVLMMLNVTQNGTQKNVWLGKLKHLPINTATTFDEWLVSNTTIDVTTIHSFVYISADVATYVSGTFSITETKVEVGNQATTWTPAPEDVDSDISTAQSTANTAVSNAATAQSGVNTLNEIIMPNGEIFSLTADNFNTDTTILDDDIGFQNSLQNTYASNPVTLKLDKEQGCYIEFVQDKTNSKFQSMYELLNRHQNAYFITDVTDLNANGYTIWTRVRLRDLTVHTDAGDIYAGIFCLGNYGNHGISLRNNNAIYASINFPSVSADTINWGFSDYVNKWIDICFTADSVNAETRKIKLYLNGVLKENKTTTTQITSGQASSVIARGGGSHNSGFTNMDFKAAKVWNRPLTAGEVAGLTKYFNTTGSATAKNINNAQSTANTAVTNLNNINLMTTASVDALFNLTSAANAIE